jgi:hypothetical protein
MQTLCVSTDTRLDMMQVGFSKRREKRKRGSIIGVDDHH